MFPFSLLWPTLLTCSGRASVTATSLSFLKVVWFPHSLLFELSCQLISRVQPGPMTYVSCLIGLRYVEPLSSFISSPLLFFLLLFPCDARSPYQLLKEVPVVGSHWIVCDPVVFTHLQCGIDPRTSGRMDCDVIDVNSAPDESAKESSDFHVHGSHL